MKLGKVMKDEGDKTKLSVCFELLKRSPNTTLGLKVLQIKVCQKSCSLSLFTLLRLIVKISIL